MRRADRLFRIVQDLRGGRLITAEKLSELHEVSTRTIYRDIVDLQASGVPIIGEAGVGYVMQGGFDLPPLMFSQDEITALVAGARLVKAWGGVSMACAAQEALIKIEAVLPDEGRHRLKHVQIHAIAPEMNPELRDRIDQIEAAIEQLERLEITYADADGVGSTRCIRPLGLWFWGKVWTLVAWCELREDFRMFRVDRIYTTKPMGIFRAERNKSLIAFYHHMECDDLQP
ncbi:helix-turn-helix transcriptional regulator [Parasulfitobacter algicola]|uniref:YafY family transcriptional regulator n=1 Tax=Parasulfitobacter algicola TaxID=2614809 RepID=A0ABX2INS2_9RHOB|nr:YafY family protein [Sulfitobacter algicola]NSX53621.1 YafY family transcriptional regulator [Sulfitobacter algicola]